MIKPGTFFRIFGEYLFTLRGVFGVIASVFLLLAGLMFIAEGLLCSAQSKISGVGDALYLSCITALTIGYGDLYPITFIGKLCSIGLGLVGITSMGIITAAAVVSIPEAQNHD